MLWRSSLAHVGATLSVLTLVGCTVGASEADDGNASSSLVAAPPVKLRFAKSEYGGCSSCSTWAGIIEVENLAYSKDVAVVWKSNSSGSYNWNEQPAKFVRSIGRNREIWSFSGIHASALQMSVRYRVGGKEYWDNNGGGDYSGSMGPSDSGMVSTDAPMGAGLDVAVTGAVASFPARGHSGNGLTVDILVRNLNPTKKVELVYTTDGWATVERASAEYRWGNGPDGETWSAHTWFGNGSKIEYAVVARQGERDAWDNNARQNFECHAAAGAFTCSGDAFAR